MHKVVMMLGNSALTRTSVSGILSCQGMLRMFHVSKTAKMEVLQLPFMPPVDGPGFTAIADN